MPNELEAAERFFSTESGRAYAKQGLAGVYTAVGSVPPEPVPQLSSSDQVAIAQFSASTAGKRLIHDKALESPEARQKLAAAIRSAAEPCRHAQ